MHFSWGGGEDIRPPTPLGNLPHLNIPGGNPAIFFLILPCRNRINMFFYGFFLFAFSCIRLFKLILFFEI